MSKNKNEKIIISKDLASIYGLHESICLQYIASWIKYNKNKQQNYKEGRYWTRISIQKIHKQNDFMKIHQIRKAVDNLVNKYEVLLKNHYHYNNTCEYAFKNTKIFNQVIKNCFFQKETNKSLFVILTNLFTYIKSLCLFRKPIDNKVISKNLSKDTVSYSDIQKQLTSRGIRLCQIPTLLKRIDNDYDVIHEKISQFDFVKRYYPEKIKGSGSYLYNSICDNWIDYYFANNIKIKKQTTQKSEKNKEPVKNNNDLETFNKNLKQKALEYYLNLHEEKKQQIDLVVKNELSKTNFFKLLKGTDNKFKKEQYNKKLDTLRTDYIIKNNLVNIENVREQLRKTA